MHFSALAAFIAFAGMAFGRPANQLQGRDTSLACVLAPETPKENYVANPPIRRDVTDGQQGIAVTLQITAVDVSTCEPAPNVMVEVWSPNARGNYGSFLRGASITDSNGVAEFQTIFPGYTSSSANHFNIAVHQNSQLSSPTVHVGQLFFTDRWTDVVAMQSPYNTNTHSRMLNSQDSAYNQANSAGYNAIVDIAFIHDDWPEGVIGSISVGVKL